MRVYLNVWCIFWYESPVKWFILHVICLSAYTGRIFRVHHRIIYTWDIIYAVPRDGFRTTRPLKRQKIIENSRPPSRVPYYIIIGLVDKRVKCQYSSSSSSSSRRHNNCLPFAISILSSFTTSQTTQSYIKVNNDVVDIWHFFSPSSLRW